MDNVPAVLTNVEPELNEIAAEYEPFYREYVTTVSVSTAAISLRQAVLCALLIRRLPLRRILDTGSGFSTFVFRREALRKGNIDHLAVEDDSSWLNRTIGFLRLHALPANQVILLGEFENDPSLHNFDLVFHDLGDPTTRLLTLPLVAKSVSASGWLILDDMHKPAYFPHVLRLLDRDWDLQSMLRLTEDELGRFAYLCRRKSSS